MATVMAENSLKLPTRLLRFFQAYPPRLCGQMFTNQRILSKQEKIAIEGDRTTENGPTKTIEELPAFPAIPQPEIPEALLQPLIDIETSQPMFHETDKPPNPFLPYKNPATGRWRGATVSLRRQAELFKLARVCGVEPLLPASRKSTAFKEARLLSRNGEGALVKGTGPGESVKGHQWERRMGPMLQKRIEAMEKMPELIKEWRQRGNGRGWRKWPKKK